MGGPRVQAPGVEEVVQTCHLHGLHKVGYPVLFEPLSRDCNKPGTLSSTVQGKQVDVTTSDIAAALHCNDEHPPADAQLDEQPDPFYVSEIIEDMCTGQYADEKWNAGSWSKLPQLLLLVHYILYRNVCLLGQKSQRRDQFLQALYAFHKGH
jgi:hypothetical protein